MQNEHLVKMHGIQRTVFIPVVQAQPSLKPIQMGQREAKF